VCLDYPVEIEDNEDEFKRSLQTRYTANPDAAIGWAAATDDVDGFVGGKGKKG
jgi:hypothetical protein